MPRRVALPGADELFRATTVDAALREADAAGDGAALENSDGAARAPEATAARGSVTRHSGASRPSGRQKHDEKITVYVSPEELIDLERSRLILRSTHSLAVDRGRIVREALAVVLADLEAKGESSILVRRLRG